MEAPLLAAQPAPAEPPPADAVAPVDGGDMPDWVAYQALPIPTPGTGEPARFAGWLQPWTVALIFGLPLLWAVLERRGDLAHALRRRAWKSGEGPER